MACSFLINLLIEFKDTYGHDVVVVQYGAADGAVAAAADDAERTENVVI